MSWRSAIGHGGREPVQMYFEGRGFVLVQPYEDAGWFAAVDHKSIGLRYIVTAFGFFAFAGVLAMLMRLQLAFPDATLFSNDRYNQFFSTHGTTMMFLFAVPVMLGFGVYLIPLMLGTRELAFPRLNAYGYWTYLIGGLLLWISFLFDSGPDAGWFSYVPLAGPEYGAGKRIEECGGEAALGVQLQPVVVVETRAELLDRSRF